MTFKNYKFFIIAIHDLLTHINKKYNKISFKYFFRKNSDWVSEHLDIVWLLVQSDDNHLMIVLFLYFKNSEKR